MSRTLSVVALGMALWLLVASAVPAADQPPAKKPPPAAAKESQSRGDEKAAAVAPAPHEKARKEKSPKEKARPAGPHRRPPVQNPFGSDPTQEKSRPVGAHRPQLYGGEATIEQALATPTQMEFHDTPLTDAIEFLKDHHRQKLGHPFDIQLDYKPLSDAGIAPDTPVTANLKGITLRSALNLLLRPLNLTWTIQDEVLLITTPEEAENRLTAKALDVADLVECRDSKGELWDDYHSLIELIKSTVMPTSWDDVGGQGSISPANMSSAKALVIRQTYQVHGEIAEVLAKILRRCQEESAGRAAAGATSRFPAPGCRCSVIHPRRRQRPRARIRNAMAANSRPQCSVEHGLIDGVMIPCGAAALGCIGQFAQSRAAVPHVKARLIAGGRRSRSRRRRLPALARS